jgi:hypothetical protein
MIKILRIRFFDSQSDNLKSKIQNRKWAGFAVITFVLVVVGAVVEAQQPTNVPRIGYLTASSLFSHIDPHRSIPAGSARAWVCGGEKHCH